MAIAHVCMDCGWDLARVRAEREPHYGLPLVVCPRCTMACVRRRHPLWTGFDRLRRVDCALTLIVLQLVFIGGFGFMTTMAVSALMIVMLDVPEFHADAVPWIVGASLIALPLATGAWLTVAFHHHPRWRVWPGWFAFMLMPMMVLGAMLRANDEFSIGPFGLAALDSHWLAGVISVLCFVMIAAVPLSFIMILAFIGIPLGNVVLWLFRLIHQHRWRWRRRMLRRRRSA